MIEADKADPDNDETLRSEAEGVYLSTVGL